MIFLFCFTLLLLVVYALLFLYYRYGWNLILEKKENGASNHIATVSVVIPFRNEAHNLPNLLHCLTSQQYPKHLLEIIFIDDHSEDGGAAIFHDLKEDHIKCVSLSEHLNGQKTNAYKKKAIETGIRLSRGELIITTDADCTMGPRWVTSIVEHYEQTHDVLLAMPVMLMPDGTVCGTFQSLDFMTMQGITAASSSLKFHPMCNGANLAYTRAAFEEVDGFTGIDQIASGDDLLLMQKIAKRYPERISFLKCKDAIVLTAPAKGWKAFLQQRIRWASKTDQYHDKKMLPVLAAVYLFNVSVFIMMVLTVCTCLSCDFIDCSPSCIPSMTAVLLTTKIGVELLLLVPVSSFFSQKKQLFYFPFLQPLHVLYIIVAGWLGKFGTYDWKGRKGI